MSPYLNLLQRILNEGTWQQNRTGIPTKRLDGAMLQFDLRDGFPAITTKTLAFKAVKGELVGFIRGYDNAAAFRKLGCNVWDQNANDNEVWVKNQNRKGVDDLGRIYGRQWRSWPKAICGTIDQLRNAVNDVIDNPTSRRIIVTAWNPAELEQMALPPCHMMFQLLVNVEDGTLSMCMYQRSCDMFLGIPFNIASYALLLKIIAAATGYKAANLTMFLADVHIYQNHMDQVLTQLTREPMPLSTLQIKPEFFDREKTAISRIDKCSPDDFELIDYAHHPAIKAEMAV